MGRRLVGRTGIVARARARARARTRARNRNRQRNRAVGGLTHLPNEVALKMDGAKANNLYIANTIRIVWC